MRNYLICWEDTECKKWAMIKEKDQKAFCLNLLYDTTVKKSSIFVIPTDGMLGAIWLWTKAHKSNRVDFWNFFEDYNYEYEEPTITSQMQPILQEAKERNGENTKYGWISPDGKYFPCGYQGHSNLADRICFGFVETNNAEHYLETHGWCKIYKSLFDDKYKLYIDGKSVITDAQIKTLISLGLEYFENISEMLVKE